MTKSEYQKVGIIIFFIILLFAAMIYLVIVLDESDNSRYNKCIQELGESEKKFCWEKYY